MTFGESYLPPLERERERVVASSLPKPTLWSAKIMVQKILGVRDLLGCKAIAHVNRIGRTQALCMGIMWDAHLGNNMRERLSKFSSIFFNG